MAEKKDREILKQLYLNKKWARRVDEMSSAQVVDICMRLKMQNKLKGE